MGILDFLKFKSIWDLAVLVILIASIFMTFFEYQNWREEMDCWEYCKEYNEKLRIPMPEFNITSG